MCHKAIHVINAYLAEVQCPNCKHEMLATIMELVQCPECGTKFRVLKLEEVAE